MDFKTDFGVVGAQELAVSEGDSFMLSDPDQVTEVQPETEGSEEGPKEPPKKPAVKLDDFMESSLLTSEEDEEEEEEEEGTVGAGGIPEPMANSEEEEEDESSEGGNPFAGLANDLYDLGIFTKNEDEEEITTPEQFKAKWEEEKKLGASQELSAFLSKFGKKHIDAFNAIFVNGVDPESFYQKQATIDNYENLNLEDDFVQEKVVKDYYKSLGWKEERIAKKIEKLRDYDDLKEEAETAQEKLVEANKNALEQEKIKKQAEVQAKEQQEQYFQNHVQQTLLAKLKEKEFDGIPLSNEIASQVYDSMTTKKWQLPSGEQLSDFDKFLLDLKRPENYDLAVKIALLAQRGFDFSDIKKKAVSEEANELFKSVRVQDRTKKRGSSPKAFTF